MVKEESSVRLSICFYYLLWPRLLEPRPKIVNQGVLEEHSAVLVFVPVKCKQENWL